MTAEFDEAWLRAYQARTGCRAREYGRRSLPQSPNGDSSLVRGSLPMPSSDERTEVPALPGFGSAALESAGFARAGRGLQAARDCFKGGGKTEGFDGSLQIKSQVPNES